MKERIITITGDIVDDNCHEAIASIEKFNLEDSMTIGSYAHKEKPITILINSFGGCVYSGLGLISAIKSSETKIITKLMGPAMSMGFMLFIVGHERHMGKYSTMMIHGLSTGVWGTLLDIKEQVDEAERLQEQINEIIFEHTKLTKKQIEKIVESGDYYYDATESLKKGFTDYII